MYIPYIGTVLDNLHTLSGVRVWSCAGWILRVRESVLPGFIRVCLVKGVQTRTSAAFIKITDTWCCTNKCREPGLCIRSLAPRPLFILNERKTMIRVDCRARCSTKADFNRVSGKLGLIRAHIIRYIIERARNPAKTLSAGKLGWKNVLARGCEARWLSTGRVLCSRDMP